MKQALKPCESQELRTIVVDLTPVLPGGENGGAKVFVLELLRRLAERAPQTQFVLLTQASAHEELAALDRANVRRVMMTGAVGPLAMRSLATKIFFRALPHLPGRLRRVAGRLGYALLTASKRSRSGTLLRDLRADLLFCPFTAPTYFELNIPTVCIVYDLQYKTYPGFFAPEDVAHRGRTFADAARRSTVLVAISDYSRGVALAEAKLDADRIKTIHLQISRHSLANAARDETILDRMQLMTGKYLIYPANFWKHKNHEMLLTAFGMACRSGLADGIRLVCTGAPGARQQWLKQAVHGFGLEGRILFPGYLTAPELLALVTNSAGMIFPSLYEGFGLPVIEAMATGVPVACSNVTSLPEVAGDAAILFDPRIPEQIARAMISLAHDKALSARLVQAGITRAASFSDSTRMAEQYWELFQQAAGLHSQSNILVGVYPDGWAGLDSKLQIGAAAQARVLNLEIMLPGGTPTEQVTLLIQHGEKNEAQISVLRGQSGRLSMPVPETGGSFSVVISPSFVPALTGGDDRRELSAKLVKCEIVNADGQRDVLFAESACA